MKEKEIRYSEILKKFVHPMIEKTDEFSKIEQKYAFGVHVWNAVNLKKSHPEVFEQARQQVIDKAQDKTEAIALFDEMANFKEKEFAQYKRVFIDFEILETIEGGYNVTAASAEIKA